MKIAIFVAAQVILASALPASHGNDEAALSLFGKSGNRPKEDIATLVAQSEKASNAVKSRIRERIEKLLADIEPPSWKTHRGQDDAQDEPVSNDNEDIDASTESIFRKSKKSSWKKGKSPKAAKTPSHNSEGHSAIDNLPKETPDRDDPEGDDEKNLAKTQKAADATTAMSGPSAEAKDETSDTSIDAPDSDEDDSSVQISSSVSAPSIHLRETDVLEKDDSMTQLASASSDTTKEVQPEDETKTATQPETSAPALDTIMQYNYDELVQNSVNNICSDDFPMEPRCKTILPLIYDREVTEKTNEGLRAFRETCDRACIVEYVQSELNGTRVL